MRDHRDIDRRSLAFGSAVAARLAKHPELIEQARSTARRWLTTCSPAARPALEQWLAALDGPREGVIALLSSNDQRSTQLRQSNPFAGALPPQERTAILLRFQRHDKASA